MRVLVVGGAGYIGSHMVRTLLEEKFDTIVFDNLSTGYREFIPEGVSFIKGDLRNESDIQRVFKEHSIDAVMHFAASSLVPESMSNPLKYYDNNVLACINLLKAAKGEKSELMIFGDDYPTPDGTCIRDFIHVQDLCHAHLLALKALKDGMKSDIFNLGSGSGYSVKEVVQTVEEVTGKKINVKIGPRRAGDPAKLVASAEKAQMVLGWKPKANLDEIIRSAWAWESKN